MTTLNVRSIEVATARTIKAAAAARGLTIAQYLHRLAMLHVAAGECAAMRADLKRLGLDAVRV